MLANDSTRTEIHYHHYHHYHGIGAANEPTAIMDISRVPYDAVGAAVFIVVVLLWFSLGFVCMLGVQIRARADTIEDFAQRRARLFITTLRDQTQKKQILGMIYFLFDFNRSFLSEELVDKEKRDKLWDIYLGKTQNTKDKLKRAELLRIQNIQKQLAVINRNRLIMNETVVIPATRYPIRRSVSESRSTFISHLTEFENRVSDRRRSSFDEQTIQGWKKAAQSVEASRTRDGYLQRYFRRLDINPLKELKPRNTSVNHLLPADEQQQLLQPLTKKSNERTNPYITYFHLPTNKSIENVPLVAINSDHHTIQMDANEYQF